jgi:hypothetical protein
MAAKLDKRQSSHSGNGPVAVTQLPVSEEAVRRQQELSDALLKALSGDRPLKISIEQIQPLASIPQTRDDRAA